MGKRRKPRDLQKPLVLVRFLYIWSGSGPKQIDTKLNQIYEKTTTQMNKRDNSTNTSKAKQNQFCISFSTQTVQMYKGMYKSLFFKVFQFSSIVLEGIGKRDFEAKGCPSDPQRHQKSSKENQKENKKNLRNLLTARFLLCI